MDTVIKYFKSAKIIFLPTIKWINDANFTGVYSPYDGVSILCLGCDCFLSLATIFTLQVRLDRMKLTHADSPYTKLNIFIPGGLDYDVTGFATFPHNVVRIRVRGERAKQG